eukprot:scaffold14173_cov104-Cylindrotheca_fusiformis.AAC.1
MNNSARAISEIQDSAISAVKTLHVLLAEIILCDVHHELINTKQIQLYVKVSNYSQSSFLAVKQFGSKKGKSEFWILSIGRIHAFSKVECFLMFQKLNFSIHLFQTSLNSLWSLLYAICGNAVYVQVRTFPILRGQQRHLSCNHRIDVFRVRCLHWNCIMPKAASWRRWTVVSVHSSSGGSSSMLSFYHSILLLLYAVCLLGNCGKWSLRIIEDAAALSPAWVHVATLADAPISQVEENETFRYNDK